MVWWLENFYVTHRGQLEAVPFAWREGKSKTTQLAKEEEIRSHTLMSRM